MTLQQWGKLVDLCLMRKTLCYNGGGVDDNDNDNNNNNNNRCSNTIR
jgi:hypothetical protein